MNSFREFNIIAFPIFVDAANTKAVIRLTRDTVTKDLHRGCRIGGQTLKPFLRTSAHLLAFKHISRGRILSWVLSRNPREKSCISTLCVDLHSHWTARWTMSGRWNEKKVIMHQCCFNIDQVLWQILYLRHCNFQRTLHFTLSWEEVLDLPTRKVTRPESWGIVLTKTRMWVRPKDLIMVWWVSRSSKPSLYQCISISSFSTSTQKAAFSPSKTSTFRGSFRKIVPAKKHPRELIQHSQGKNS